jgi:ATP-dependent DNA ligase
VRRLGDGYVIDGEIIVLNSSGLSDFGELRKAITRRQHDLYFVAFDLLASQWPRPDRQHDSG